MPFSITSSLRMDAISATFFGFGLPAASGRSPGQQGCGGSTNAPSMPRALRSVLDVRLQHSHCEPQMGHLGFSTGHSFLR